MRWSVKQNGPVLGDTRIKIKFAYFPKRLKHGGDYETVWLERYRSNQEYKMTFSIDTWWGDLLGIHNRVDKWVEISSY